MTMNILSHAVVVSIRNVIERLKVDVHSGKVIVVFVNVLCADVSKLGNHYSLNTSQTNSHRN